MRRPEPVEIYTPASVGEASALMKKLGAGGRFLAGGTDLVIAMKEKGLSPKYIVDLKRIPSLSGIREQADGSIVIGALTTMREVETCPLIVRRFPFLARSAAEVGSIQIRNRATIGGNMANATPSADVAPSLLVLDTQARIAAEDHERTVALEDFFRGPGQTVLGSDEILCELVIPPSDRRLVGEYIKFSPREMMDLAYVGVAVALVLNDRRCERARIALGAVAPTPLRARNAEAILLNQVLNEEIAEKAAAAAASECKPISDVRSSAAYRREMVRAMTKRALLNAALAPPPASWAERRERRYR
ncbi:MAG TPA: xanthine dehydrogenase family protein subunit M [Candidatus Acidoferrales bacterium]|nr:xanthine dehydrogenase family protein subunit M [Candidatus Acidoferrales bacterium]